MIKIGIVGPNGNVGIAFTNAIKNYTKGYTVYPLTRDYFVNNMASNSPRVPLSQLDIIILAVKPKDAMSALYPMRNQISPETLFISPVSCLNSFNIKTTLNIAFDRIVTLTLNTNIEYGQGIVAYNATGGAASREIIDLLTPFSKKIEAVPQKDIQKNVTIIGSGNAFWARYLALRAVGRPEAQFDHFNEYISTLTMEDTEIQKFIQIMKTVCRKVFNNDSFVEASFLSTLETLKISCSSVKDVEKHIEKVATEGGCTRMGIDDFISLEVITEKFFLRIFSKVHKKVLAFERGIKADFKKLSIPASGNKHRKCYSSHCSSCSKL